MKGEADKEAAKSSPEEVRMEIMKGDKPFAFAFAGVSNWYWIWGVHTHWCGDALLPIALLVKKRLIAL